MMMDKSIGDGVTMKPDEKRGGRRAFAPGDAIAGRYVVERILGEGGMGIVYQCLDRVGGVKVAVKCLPPEVSRSADEMEDIRANYRLVADLHHSNIAGARLPTEHEWEYACRAGTRTKYSWGDVLNGHQANCDGNYPEGTEEKGPCLERTTPVGSYASKGCNDWGFCDMHGNVWEWCEDKYDSSGSYRVLRGGSWGRYASVCRSACRNYFYPSNRYSNYGFRLCCSAGPHE